jgi:hypothetical protein
MYPALCLYLHIAFLFLLSPTFWHDLFTQTPTKVIAAAAVVTTVTQLIKKTAPDFFSGYVAMAINLAASVAAVYVGMNPANFWTETTAIQILVIFLGAAGIHSTAKSMSKPTADPNAPSDAVKQPVMIGTMKGAAPSLLLFIAVCLISGCKPVNAPPAPLAIGAVDSVDSHANQILQTIHAFLLRVSTDVQSGAITLTPAQRQILDKANTSENLAALAEQAYHAAGGGNAADLNAKLATAQNDFGSVQASIGTSIGK